VKRGKRKGTKGQRHIGTKKGKRQEARRQRGKRKGTKGRRHIGTKKGKKQGGKGTKRRN